ncbi:MAG: AAA family ATPase [Ferruginibacter sp.]
MKIAKIRVASSETETVSLKEINLTNKPLGSTVALVGKNGAGKSRILKFVETYISKITPETFLENHLLNIPSQITSPFNQNIKTAQRHIDALKNSNTFTAQQKKATEDAITSNLSPIIQRLNQLGRTYVKVVDNDDLQKIKTQIANNITFDQLLSNTHFEALISNPNILQQATSNPQLANSILLNEFTVFNSQQTVNYLNNLTSSILTKEVTLYLENRDNPNIISQKIKDEESYKLFAKFQTYVRQFLGKEFSYKQVPNGNVVDSALYFNNTPFNIQNLSPGQKTLFAYAILFFYLDTNLKTNIRDSIIIIDEPEKHLHPEAQITLINALKNIIGKTGQLWIATHSVHILSHLDYDEILMVKDNEIIPPSRTTPGKSFNDLMGLEDHIQELKSFITSISEWAYGNFMTQCFKEPDVIFSNNINDPQFKIFKDFLQKNTRLSLLDYGAGKGRIGYTIQEDEETSTKIIYSAYEPDKSNYEYLHKVPKINSIYSNISEIPKNDFDCVILCNVLHEISPNDWLTVLNTIKECLKKDGFLLIIEDRFLPKGETAHEFGYIILNAEETTTLMMSENAIELKLQEVEYKDRIVFTAFPKNSINPSNESIKEAIRKLKSNSFNNIKNLKKQEININQGRRLANETQLYINSQMYLETVN